MYGIKLIHRLNFKNKAFSNNYVSSKANTKFHPFVIYGDFNLSSRLESMRFQLNH